MRTLLGVQYLRAIAALSVLWFHAARGAGGHDALGTGGVDIFFVVSGFLMFELAALQPQPAKFALDRVKRIVPAYWIVTLIVAGFQISGYTERSSFNLQHLVKSLLFLPDWDPVRQHVYPTLIVGWTLNYEMFFYAIVTLLLSLRERWRIFGLAFAFTLLLALGLVFRGRSLALDFYSDPIILEFFAGAILSIAWRARSLPRKGWPFVVVGVLLLIAPQPMTLHRIVGYGVPATMIVLGVLAEEARHPIRLIKPLKLLGDASYSIYLWHLFLVAAVFKTLGETPPAFALAVIGGVAIGLLSYRLIERPLKAALGQLAPLIKQWGARDASADRAGG